MNSLPSPSCPDARKRRVCYYYDSAIANADFGKGHLMVPSRAAMAHGLVASYGLLADMRRLRTRPATAADLLLFHDADYVDLLHRLTPRDFRHKVHARDKAREHGVGEKRSHGCYDCPAMAGLWDYCLRYAGGSLAAARALAGGDSDVAVSWSGGMHHACSGKASGFCYVNDIVLAVKQLLPRFRRVLYVDIDAHHGDGVEAAFADTNQVMTVSFHRYGDDFFPKTGAAGDVGVGAGEHHSVNVPLPAGTGDGVHAALFEPIVGKAMERFQPGAVVLQCGADSLSGDRVGGMELTVRGHARCVGFLRGFNVPLLLLGGGGYTINHVASCWCYETAVAVGKETEIADEIPSHGYDHYYKGQGYKLLYDEPATAATSTQRSPSSEETKMMETALDRLCKVVAVPSVQFKEAHDNPDGDDDDDDDGELYDEFPPSEEEDDPMQRLHRLCGEADLADFFAEQGRKRYKRFN